MPDLWNWKESCSSSIVNMYHAIAIMLSHNDCFIHSPFAPKVLWLFVPFLREFLNTDFWLRSSAGCFFMLMFDLDILYPSWEQGHVICVCWPCDVLSEAFAGVYNCWLAGDRNAIGVLAFSSKLDLHIKSLPENVGSEYCGQLHNQDEQDSLYVEMLHNDWVAFEWLYNVYFTSPPPFWIWECWNWMIHPVTTTRKWFNTFLPVALK